MSQDKNNSYVINNSKQQLVYKNSNNSFSNQGAVSGSSRINRLRYQEILKSQSVGRYTSTFNGIKTGITLNEYGVNAVNGEYPISLYGNTYPAIKKTLSGIRRGNDCMIPPSLTDPPKFNIEYNNLKININIEPNLSESDLQYHGINCPLACLGYKKVEYILKKCTGPVIGYKIQFAITDYESGIMPLDSSYNLLSNKIGINDFKINENYKFQYDIEEKNIIGNSKYWFKIVT